YLRADAAQCNRHVVVCSGESRQRSLDRAERFEVDDLVTQDLRSRERNLHTVVRRGVRQCHREAAFDTDAAWIDAGDLGRVVDEFGAERLDHGGVSVRYARRSRTEAAGDQAPKSIGKESIARQTHPNGGVARLIVRDEAADLKTVSTIAAQGRG